MCSEASLSKIYIPFESLTVLVHYSPYQYSSMTSWPSGKHITWREIIVNSTILVLFVYLVGSSYSNEYQPCIIQDSDKSQSLRSSIVGTWTKSNRYVPYHIRLSPQSKYHALIWSGILVFSTSSRLPFFDEIDYFQ